MNSIQKHALIRGVILTVGLVISIIVALINLDPKRRCGTGDGLLIGFLILGFYTLSSIILIIEAIVLHIKKKKRKGTQTYFYSYSYRYFCVYLEFSLLL